MRRREKKARGKRGIHEEEEAGGIEDENTKTEKKHMRKMDEE